MVKLKFPSLNLDQCKDYIKRARISNGGSLTGLQMGKIIVLIKKLIKEGQSTHKQKEKFVGKTCNLCFRTFSRNWSCKRHIQKAHALKETDDKMEKPKL